MPDLAGRATWWAAAHGTAQTPVPNSRLPMPPYRRQHWVPQSYLRRFSPDGRRIHAFDLQERAAKFLGIADVAHSPYFNEAFLRHSDAPKADPRATVGLLEREYRRWEDALNGATANIERSVAGEAVALGERLTLATCIAVQMVRTPAYRARLVEALLDELTDDFITYLAREAPELASFARGRRLQLTSSVLPSLLHAYAVWRTDLVPGIAAALEHYVWVLGINESSVPLYTSDTPVIGCRGAAAAAPLASAEAWVGPPAAGAVNATVPISVEELVALDTASDIEVSFPLTPRLVILLYHPAHFAALRARDGHVLMIGTETVRRLNGLQARMCERHVFSRTDDFSVARQVRMSAR